MKETVSQRVAFRLNLPSLAFLLIFLSFHMYGVGTISVGGLNVAPWDWATLLIVMLCLMYLARSRVRVSRSLILGLGLALLFFTWISVSAFFSPQPERALTMMLLQLRNLLLMLCIGILFSSVHTLAPLNRAIFWTGVMLSSGAIVIYIFAFFQFQRILSDPSLWKPTIGYVLDQGGVLRLIGFARDPNFYSLWMALPFFCGLSLPSSLTKWTGISIIGMSLVLAMSRGFILSFSAATLLVIGIAIVCPRIRRKLGRYIRSMVVSGLLLVSVAGVWVWHDGGLWEFITRRIELAPSTPRFVMWETLLHTEFNPIWGSGLRGAEEVLGGYYSHNSYLDVIFETGLVGFLLWALIIGYVSLSYFSRLEFPEWVPWVHSWLIMLGMFASLSLVYHPFLWLMAAVNAGAFPEERRAKRHCVRFRI